MTQRRLGTTPLSVAPLVLGGNVFGWTADRAASFAVLDAFVAGGGTMVDTADVYSAWVPGHEGGESETVLGAWLRERGNRNRIQVATKVGMLPIDGDKGLTPGHIAAACEASLRRLGTDHIDLYYAHRDDDAVPQEAAAEAFGRLVEQGKVRAVAASNYSAERLASARAAADAVGAPRFEALQPEYNLVSRGGFEGPLQDYCVAENVGVLPYYGLASGFLTGKYRSEADLSKSVRGARMKDLLEGRGASVLAALDRVAEETGATQAQVSLAWVIAQPGVTGTIASATSARQLEELLPAMTLELTSDQLASLTAASV